ncbi:MAG: hypothetical protein EAZ57_11665 [Cytophagales bacterium]|nr:MAG: hypothetical protein EAZ67_12560 [Cytophagales bacterium]TAF59305.1 MAG: hypothetical protein EAZ57_11665 [Cytophagales bacterium]
MKRSHQILSGLIATVWLINGIYCKILGFVPRHEQIVERVLGAEWASPLIVCIGVAEVTLAVWFLSGYQRRVNSILQMLAVSAMNVLEFFLARDLLLWGYWNAVFAAIFVLLVGLNEFWIRPKAQTL